MIYTFGDGFAAGHIWPEWPQFLEIFTDGQVVNHGVVGAGNELIFNTAIKQAIAASSDDVFIIQWAKPERFDKVIEDSNWQELQQSDNTYKNNRYGIFDLEWWPTSASTLPEVRHYHDFYIQSKQSNERSMMYMLALSGYLKSLGIVHHYLLSYDVKFDGPLASSIAALPWLTAPSLETWSRQFSFRGEEVQPSPLVHYKFVQQFLLPSLGIVKEEPLLGNIEDRVRLITTEPFYYDRAQEWDNFKNEVSLLFK